MSVIIRLQNLPWSANSLDIRHYFRGLSIPEGGVHIVGGEMGDAFIAFSTDEDARQAMMLAGGKIKEVQISLMLSSRSEMQKIIKAARQASMSSSLAQLLAPQSVPLGTIPQQPQQPVQPQAIDQERRDSKGDKKDSSDLSSGGHEGGRRDRRDKSRSRSRDRNRKDRRDRDRDRDRDRRRKTRSRSRSRDRRRRRSRSRSRGRDNHNRERDRKDLKEDPRKEKEVLGTMEAGTNLPNLNILNPSTWNVMQKGALAPNALLTNFELLRNLANQKGPLIPGGPNALLSTPINLDASEASPGFGGETANRGNDFGNRGGKGNQRFKSFEDGNAQDGATFGGDGRFDRNRGPKNFQNFGPGFPMRNGSEPLMNNRFGNFGRPENGFMPRGVGVNRPNQTRGLLDFPVTLPQRDDRNANRQERFNNREDRVDEFGRSVQLRNRKNASVEDGFNEDNSKFQGNQGNFQGFPNRFGANQQNVRPPPLLRGRDNWSQGGGRGFRGSFDDSSRGGFRSKGRGESFGKYSEESDRGVEKDCCVEIRNLLPQIAYGEVRRPFSNLKLVIREIKFFDYGANDKKCRIRFLNNEHKKKAFGLSSKILIDNKQVQLIDINDSDFDECVDEGVRRPDAKFSDDEDDSQLTSKDCYVQVKDVPLDVDEMDIANLFPNVILDKIILKASGDGKCKNAYIKFQKAVDAKVALGTANRSIGDSSVFLTPLSQYAFNDALHQGEKGEAVPEAMEVSGCPEEEKEPTEEGKQETTCIFMKNLPTEANDRDICDFFSDIGLVPNKIHLMLDASGQPCGDAFCEFSDHSQVERACTKNLAPLGKNSVIVNEIPRGAMLEALGLASRKGPMVSPNKLPSLTDSFGRPQCVLALENVPFRATTQDIIGFFGWSYKLTENDVVRRYNERGQPTGDGKICLRTPEDALRALRFLNNRTLLGRAIRMKLI